MGITCEIRYNEFVAASIRMRSATMFRVYLFCIVALSGFALTGVPASRAAEEPIDPWPGLVQDIFNNLPMNDGGDVISIEMPYRAEDAAIVPVTLRSRL